MDTFGPKKGEAFETSSVHLQRLFGYFYAMRMNTSRNRYFDWNDCVRHVFGETGGPQGDPAEMLAFCQTTLHTWGRVMGQHLGERAVAYADDGYFVGRLSAALEILSKLRKGFRDDAGLELNIKKTQVLCKVDVADAKAAAQGILDNHPEWEDLTDLVTNNRFTKDGFIGVGVPLGTPAFVETFIKSKCHEIIEDIDLLDDIEDGLVHFKLLRYCQATRLQFINGHVALDNQNVLQQQHVDAKIVAALSKKGAGSAGADWTPAIWEWVSMVMHSPHAEGGWGVCANRVSRLAALWNTKARFVAWLGHLPQEAQAIWLPNNDLAVPEDWQQPGLLQLTKAHAELISKYRCKEGPAPAASQDPADARSRRSEAMVLRLPQLNALHEAHSRDNGAIAPGQQASQAAASREPRIPTQRELTRQISANWGPFLHTRRNPPNARLAEEMSLRATQTYHATVQDSTLREEMRALEPAQDDAQPRTLTIKAPGLALPDPGNR